MWRKTAVHERLIPARAGNTSEPPRKLGATPAHPRSRGEHFSPTTNAYPSAGSSPLARGTHDDMADAAPVERLIPARAGNTYLIAAPRK